MSKSEEICACGSTTFRSRTFGSQAFCLHCGEPKPPPVIETKSEYTVTAATFHGALAQLVVQFRQQNPGLSTFQCVCDDGTKVTIKVGKGPLPRKKV